MVPVTGPVLAHSGGQSHPVARGRRAGGLREAGGQPDGGDGAERGTHGAARPAALGVRPHQQVHQREKIQLKKSSFNLGGFHLVRTQNFRDF